VAILAALLGLAGRFAGKLLTTTLGWASTLLFGRVPDDRQIVLAIVTFGSVVWAALVVGVILPYVGAFLVAAVPAPGLIEEGWLRLGMLAGALLVPAVVGIATIFVVEPARRPSGTALVAQALRGYPLSAALALILILLALVGIVRFVHHLALRWTSAHIPIVVRPGGYDRVVADVQRTLDDAGLAVDPRDAPAVMSVPGRLLGSIAGPGIRPLVPTRLVHLTGPGLEVGLYPSDISISGSKLHVARARAAIASRLVATAAWLTTSAESQEIEARLERLTAADVPGGVPGAGASAAPSASRDAASELESIDEALAVLVVPHEEWEVLYRERLQVERDLLAGAKPGGSFPGATAAAERAAAPSGAHGRPAGERRSARTRPLPGWVSGLAAAAGFVLIVADVVLALAGRRRG
jgi:hypothetical protein